MSEFWKRKMRTYFSLFDYDKDGVISKDDWMKMPVLFASFENADKQKAEHLKTGFNDAWEQIMKKAATKDKTRMTAEVLIDSVGKQLNSPELMQPFANFIRGFYNLMDLNCDGYLQEDEHRRLFQQLGISDTSFAKVAFNSIDINRDGKLSDEELLYAFFDFLFSQDEKSPNTLYFGPLVD